MKLVYKLFKIEFGLKFFDYNPIRWFAYHKEARRLDKEMDDILAALSKEAQGYYHEICGNKLVAYDDTNEEMYCKDCNDWIPTW